MNHSKLATSVLIILLVSAMAGVSYNGSRAQGSGPPGLAGLTGSSSLNGQASGGSGLPYNARAHRLGLPELAQTTPGWQQVNSNGFGVQQADEVSAVEAFNGYLYAGTSNPADGARIFRSPDGVNWTPMTQPGFGIGHDTAPPAILDLAVFNSRIYASTGRGDGPGQIWRALTGVYWAPMTITGFSNPDTVDITALAVFNNFIYAGANNLISGALIYRSNSGDNNTWTQVGPAVTRTGGARVTGFAVFGEALYAAVESQAPAQIWRSYGGDWTIVISNGFGNSLTKATGGMAEFAGSLYVGVGNEVEGAQLWRTSDGSNWEQAIEPGFGDANNQTVEMVFVFQNTLYAGVKNVQTGIELWRSADGTVWEQANPDGFGDSKNSSTNWSNATAEFLGDLYVGTSNVVDGGELWRLQQPGRKHLYLPVSLRWP